MTREEMREKVRRLFFDHYDDRIKSTDEAADAAIALVLEEAAKEIEPKREVPCSCVEVFSDGSCQFYCECINSGDAEDVSYWCTAKNNAAAIRALKEGK